MLWLLLYPGQRLTLPVSYQLVCELISSTCIPWQTFQFCVLVSAPSQCAPPMHSIVHKHSLIDKCFAKKDFS